MRVPLVVAAALTAALTVAGCKPAAPPTKDYAYPAWGFKVSLPAPPSETRSPPGAPASDRFESVAGDRHFVVWAADVSRTGLSLDNLAKDASGYIAKQMKATASVPTYAATAEGVAGREYQLSIAGKWRATLRVFLAGGRFYEVIGNSTVGQDDPALTNFLASFHTIGGAPPASNTAVGSKGG